MLPVGQSFSLLPSLTFAGKIISVFASPAAQWNLTGYFKIGSLAPACEQSIRIPETGAGLSVFRSSLDNAEGQPRSDTEHRRRCPFLSFLERLPALRWSTW